MMMSESQRAMMRSHGILVGRVLIGLLFLYSGVGMLMNMGLSGVTAMVAGVGVPLASVAAIIMLLIKIGGGAALILGYRVGYAAGALFIFTLLTVLLVHIKDAEPTSLLKNLAIMGGLLYVIAFGAGEGWRLVK